MKRDRAREFWPVIKAYGEGAIIEEAFGADGPWKEVIEPKWYANAYYRVKNEDTEIK